VRNIRKDALDSVKKLKNLVSEDDVRKLTKDVRFVSNYICHVYIYIYLSDDNFFLLLQVDALTEKKIEKVTKMLKDKEVKLLE
jgi:hypothetical protein